MILRDLERRPWRAAVSVLALSLAGATLIVGFYFYDAIDYLIQVEFQNASREDVTVTLNEVHGSNARHALAQLPGTLRSEPFRVVAARLRFEHRSRRVAIMGLEPGRQLRRIVDIHEHAIDLPPEGLVVSSSLAKSLGVSPGDEITMEVLEGRRPVGDVKIAATVDDLIGTSAYMDISALNRLMREGQSISGAFMAGDALMASRLLAEGDRVIVPPPTNSPTGRASGL